MLKNKAKKADLSKKQSAVKSPGRNKNVIDFEAARPKKLSKKQLAKQNELIMEFRDKAQKLARSFMRRWRAHMDYAELDSIVDLSLCEAASRFDPKAGAAFMTFLFYHLKGNLIRVITASASNYAVPIDFAELENNDRRPKSHAYRSMNSIEITEALAIKEIETPDRLLQRKELFQIAGTACEKLDTLEQEVIFRIFMKGEKLMRVAKELGYSRCHISRVKGKALTQLNQQMQESLKMADEKVDFVEPVKERKKFRRKKAAVAFVEENREVA